MLASRQANLREFFLGGRRLPWLAVCGSIISTEISAVTLTAVPALVYRPVGPAGGDLTYLQLILGATMARFIVGIWFVRAYYQHGIYSPYDYMAQQLGERARTVATGLFVLGAVLGQSVRLLLTAMILELVTGIPLSASIWLMGAIAVLWTWLGGMETIVWTDVIQFFIFLGAIVLAIIMILSSLPGGWAELVETTSAAGKLRLWNFTTDPSAPYTLWTALFANTVMCVAVFGTDQMMAQRMFCCRGPRQAGWAIIGSSIGQGVAVLSAIVGLGLYALHQRTPLDPALAKAVTDMPDRVFPLYILTDAPVGVKGLILAGIFAAAIAGLDSVLAALSQTVMSATARFRKTTTAQADSSAQELAELKRARTLVIGWAIVLCGAAELSRLSLAHYAGILDLALAMATYTAGPLLAGFLLALLRVPVDATGLLWAGPLSVVTVFGITWRQPWAHWVLGIALALLVAAWVRHVYQRAKCGSPLQREMFRTALLLSIVGLSIWLHAAPLPFMSEPLRLAFPWNVPVGAAIGLLLGYGLADHRPRASAPPEPAPQLQTAV